MLFDKKKHMHIKKFKRQSEILIIGYPNMVGQLFVKARFITIDFPNIVGELFVKARFMTIGYPNMVGELFVKARFITIGYPNVASTRSLFVLVTLLYFGILFQSLFSLDSSLVHKQSVSAFQIRHNRSRLGCLP